MMQSTMELENMQMTLPELVDHLTPGDEVILTRNHQTVAKLVSETPKMSRPAPGLGKGSIIYMAPDFDAPLDEFKEYME
jgi:antitoxin (DNA-binding transcriptional repressor) of toxin-antitoxin stability system